MTPGGDDDRILSKVLQGVLIPHGFRLGPDSPVEHFDAVAQAIVAGLDQFGWSLYHDPESLQATIDKLVAQMPPTCQGIAARPPERLGG